MMEVTVSPDNTTAHLVSLIADVPQSANYAMGPKRLLLAIIVRVTVGSSETHVQRISKLCLVLKTLWISYRSCIFMWSTCARNGTQRALHTI
jgi:hypothetical protein